MKAIIHSNWNSDIVLEEGELEKISKGEIISGEIAICYKELGEVSLSKWDNEFSGYYFNLEWNIKTPLKYNFEITSSGIEVLQKNNHIHGRYDNGLNGSKLEIYGPKKDEITKENIEFAIEMIKMNKEDEE
ncbi:MAG TPA: hypothetical protein PK357_03110 [Candidatus Pacearchaeota archaeon]|nr:hypothetical protein [Candidatus Pacearchaeota archaeon]